MFDDSGPSGAQLVTPGVIFQRVPWYEDAGVIGAALAASTLILLPTLLAWPVAALWRCWRRTAWSENAVSRRMYATARLVALAGVIGAALAASTLILLPTLLVAALWRWWDWDAWSENAVDRRMYVTARLVALVDVAVIVATLTLFAFTIADLTYLTDALDPWLVIFYVLAWL